MAITKLMNIGERKGKKNSHKGLEKALNYIVNGAKTEGGKLVGVSNILLNGGDLAQTAYDQMIETKTVIGKLRDRQGYHYIIAFPKDEGVTPQQALEIGREFCEDFLRNYESVYAVHVDKDHVHVHVVFNSVPFAGGRKYRYEDGDWAKLIQPFVNKLCRERGLSEIDVTQPGEREYNSYGAWKNDRRHPERAKRVEGSFYSYARIRADIDRCIMQASSYEEFLVLLQSEGYKVDDSRKHLRLFAPGRNRVVRAYILTPDHATYTKENIKKMIAGAYCPVDRREVLSRMYEDWNVFLRTERIKVTRTKRWNLEFAQKEEAVRMLLEKGIQNTDDAEVYLHYIEAADRELNVIRKYAKGCVDRCGVYAEEMRVIVDFVRNKECYAQGVTFDYEQRKAIEAYERLLSAGVSPVALYKMDKTAEHVMECVDAYKKKLYVDKVKMKRAEEMLAKAEKKQERLKQGEKKQQEEKMRK